MKTKTESILGTLNVLAWVAFFALMLQAGAYLFSFCMTIIHPEGAKNFYNGLNLYSLEQYSYFNYAITVLLMVGMTVLEAYTAYFIIKLLSGIKLKSPFTPEIAKLMETISKLIFGIWLLAMAFDAHAIWMMELVPGLKEDITSGGFIFLAGVVFVLAQVFKKGVEIQSENELTV